MFPNKNWSLGGLKALIKKTNNTSRPAVRRIEQWSSSHCPYSTCVVNFLISAFSPSRLQFLLGNNLSNRFAPHSNFSRKDLIKYLASVLIPIIDVQVLTDVTITSSIAKNMYK